MPQLSSLSKGMQSLSRVDFKEIKKVESQIAKDREQALAFVRDPNKYMRKHAKGYLPKSLHFHVRTADCVFPSDTVIPENQIVISTTLVLHKSFREDVLAEIHRLQSKESKIKPLYCGGCGECKIAIVK